ncbi:MAG TPA: hypothetical protein GXX56_07225 [Rhodocyclaceae bacterium]|nr:hypothetical protein [Rhodocyclaceae bacterium]
MAGWSRGRSIRVMTHDACCCREYGCEIPAEHLPRRFDQCYRADSSRQRATKSSGLGLAITRSIVLAHGGEVDVCSAKGLTRFTLLPPTSPSR